MNENSMKRKKAPSDLGPAGRRFWKKVLDEYLLEETHDLERLRLAAKALDRIAEAEKVLDAEGPYIKDRFSQVREHPAMKTMRDFMTVHLRAVRELGLDLTTGPDTRPTSRY